MTVTARFATAMALAVTCVVSAPACGSANGSVFGPVGSSDAGGSSGGSSGSFLGHLDSGPPTVACPAGLTCNVPCDGATTTVSGFVYDPAGRDPLFDVAVYVPALALQPLPAGVPTGADACDCSALFPSGSIASTTTAIDGSFVLANAPVGARVTLVAQVGKWRRVVQVPVTACADNRVSLALPASVTADNPDDSMPNIAVSTGSADTLECLMHRMGLPLTEYSAGPGGSGHVHLFLGGGGYVDSVGRSEAPPPPGAPQSYASLWGSQAELMPYDLVLLSCEGGETYEANPVALQEYLDAGGRVFASHYHYAWFAGPRLSGQSYPVPESWGDNLAHWPLYVPPDNPALAAGQIVQTLDGSSEAFVKGRALDAWLGRLGALGQDGVPAGELSLYTPRFDAQVTSANKASQAWISSAYGGQTYTSYFSFDTPVAQPTDGAAPRYCGRAVFSDLHVSAGNPATHDTLPTPAGCADTELSPQEKALEFMIFDLSSCVVADSVPPVVMPPPVH